jgi:3-dehydroquinate synthase
MEGGVMAKSIEIQGNAGTSRILVGESYKNLGACLPTGKRIMLTDSNVRRYYPSVFDPEVVIEVGTGEKVKDLETMRSIYERLVELEADRSSFLVGLGGGVVCDLTGFAASTYLRGIPFGLVPTTLLAQVDAALGGKNGVNFSGYKNLIGTITQPEFVLCDPQFLKTLPPGEISCGLAEIIKHAVIEDRELFSFLEDQVSAVLQLDPEVMGILVYRSLSIKAVIVGRDEREKGERRKLNFGHTLGHALEKVTGLPHGEAVSLGMVLAAELSIKKGYLTASEGDRLKALLQQFGLPVRLSFSDDRVTAALKMDKKRTRNSLHFVFLKGIGSCEVEEIDLEELVRMVGEIIGQSFVAGASSYEA